MKNLLATFIMLAAAAMLIPRGIAQEQHAASIVGKWHFVLQTDGGERNIDSVFQQNGDQVTGKWGSGDVKGTFTDGKLNLEFPFTSEEAGAGTMKIKGQISDDALAGDWSFNEYSGVYKATRIKD